MSGTYSSFAELRDYYSQQTDGSTGMHKERMARLSTIAGLLADSTRDTPDLGIGIEFGFTIDGLVEKLSKSDTKIPKREAILSDLRILGDWYGLKLSFQDYTLNVIYLPKNELPGKT